MMDMNTAANVAEIAGGIAILVSLTYAGFQIRQSNRIAKAQSVSNMMSSDFLDQHNMANVGRALNDFDSLDFDAKWEFHTYFMRLFSNYLMVAQTRDLGLIQDTYVDQWTKVVAATVVTVGGQQYWESGAKESLEPGIVKILENYIEKNGATIRPYNQYMKWMMETG
jgi:hypothetical protein